MDLRQFKFPTITGMDLAFPTLDTDRRLLDEAKARGFYKGNTVFNRLFFDLFYGPGRLICKPGIPDEFRNAALAYLSAYMGSFAPKYSDREAVCALILSELCEPVLSEEGLRADGEAS